MSESKESNYSSLIRECIISVLYPLAVDFAEVKTTILNAKQKFIKILFLAYLPCYAPQRGQPDESLVNRPLTSKLLDDISLTNYES